MSGIVGHATYAILGAKAARQRRLSVAPLIARHWAAYLAGSYLGCDIQTMPEAVCLDTGREVGYGTVPLEKSPLTQVREFCRCAKDLGSISGVYFTTFVHSRRGGGAAEATTGQDDAATRPGLRPAPSRIEA